MLQAEDELDCEWGILEMAPKLVPWAGANLKDLKIGADPTLFTQSQWKSAEETLKRSGKNLSLTPIQSLVDKVSFMQQKKSEQYLGPRRKGVKDHQFRKIAMTKRSLTL